MEMMPNMDPRALKSMMAKMGIKSSELAASDVVIHCADRDIRIENPQITTIEMNGAVSFQISGNVTEKEKSLDIEISESDVRMVMEKTGVKEEEKARKAIRDANGDIAAAIMSLS